MKLIQAANDTNNRILRTDNGLQLWRKWKTPAYKKICQSQKYIERYQVFFYSIQLKYFNTKPYGLNQVLPQNSLTRKKLTRRFSEKFKKMLTRRYWKFTSHLKI